MNCHRIRLHGPWKASHQPGGTSSDGPECVRLERAFHKPSGIQAGDRLMIGWRTAEGIAPRRVRLNQTEVDPHLSEEFWGLDVSTTLIGYNVLEIDLPVASLSDGWSVGRFQPGPTSSFLVEVFLEITSCESGPERSTHPSI